jgi:glycosyltransferase involved in cell wall biosynthesis
MLDPSAARTSPETAAEASSREATKKLVIMIPCLDEAETLPETFRALPKKIDGIDAIETLVVDDGSRDGTADVARSIGVDHVLSLPWNMGLATAFMLGAMKAVELGADFVVNTDADNQYCADDIPTLVRPLLESRADIVVGERPIQEIQHFSIAKKWLQRLGSLMVRTLSGTQVRDSPSGFRALTRRAVLRTNIFNRYTYTHEMLIVSGRKGLRVVGVPIRVNPGVRRPSRLVRSVARYVYRSAITIVRMYYVYAPGKFFSRFAIAFGLVALILIGRFFYFYFQSYGEGWVQSLVIAAIAATLSGLFWVLAVLGDMININRLILEDIQFMERERWFRDNDAASAKGRAR